MEMIKETLKEMLKKAKELLATGRGCRSSDFKEIGRINVKELMNHVIIVGDPEILNNFSELVAIGLKCSGVKMNRTRNIFGYIKKIEITETAKQGDLEKDTIMKLNLLIPKISYLIGRAENFEKDGLELLKQCIEEGVSFVAKNREYFKNFNRFFEAVIAYFRFYYK